MSNQVERPQPMCDTFNMNIWNRKILAILFNVSSFLINAIVMILLHKNVLPVRELGFFCNDNSIRYPYKQETVSIINLVIINTAVAIAVFVVGEMYATRQNKTC